MQHVRTVATEAGPHPVAILGAGAWVTQSLERLETLGRKCREHLCRVLDALAACLTDNTADSQDFSVDTPSFFCAP
jgi:hypothetical protein